MGLNSQLVHLPVTSVQAITDTRVEFVLVTSPLQK